MRRLCTWLACAALVAAPLAAQEATLSLQPLSEGPLAPGDTLVVGIYVDAGALELTSASAYVRCDPSLLHILTEMPTDVGSIAPFVSGSAWTATVYENAGDPLTGQLSYVAVSRAAADGERAVASGRFLLASARLRLVGLPPDGRIELSLDAGGRRQSTYTLSAEPGVERRFYIAERTLAVAVEGEGFVPLPDRIVAAGQSWTVDLATYYSGPMEAVVAWGADADEGIDLQRQGSVLRLEAAAEGMVRYWADGADGRRYFGAFAVRFVAQPVYIQAGGLIEIDEDSGAYRIPLSRFLLDGAAEGAWDAWAEEGADVRVEGDALVVEPVPDWSGQTEFGLRFCAMDNTCQTEDWLLLVHADNDPPAFADLKPLELVVGQRQVLPLNSLVHDVDDDLDALVLEVSESAQVKLVREGYMLVVEALAVGDAEVNLSVVDPAGAAGTAVWSVRVSAPSAGPQLTASPGLRVIVGQVATIDLSAFVEDIDSALEDLAWTVRGEGVEVSWQEEAGSLVELYATEGSAAALYVQVRDRQGNEATAVWSVAIEAVSEDAVDFPAPVPVEGPGDATQQASPDSAASTVDEAEVLPAEGDRADALPEADEGFSEEAVWPDEGGSAPAASAVGDGSESSDTAEQVKGDTADVPVAEGEETAADSAAVYVVVEEQQDNAGDVEAVEGEEGGQWELMPIDLVQLRAGASWSVELSPYVQGIQPEALRWSAVAGPGVAVSLAGSRAALQVEAGYYGRTQLVFRAVDAVGRERSLSLVVEVIVPWSLADIPDVELAQGDSLFIDLSTYVDADVAWSATGGEGLSIEWADGGALLRVEEGFSGRSALIFTAVDEAGYSAADAVRVEVRAGDEPEDSGAPGVDAAEEAAGGGSVELALGWWGDVALAQGGIWTTPPLDELVLSGAAVEVQWSLRGGAFVTAHIDSARRVVLNGALARMGREVFWLVAVWNDQRREVALGVQVGAREPTLRVPEGEVLATPDGYDLAHLLDGDSTGVAWSGEADDAQVYIADGLLFVRAEPGLYAVLLAAHLPSGRRLGVNLSVRVPAETVEGEALEEAQVKVAAAADEPLAPAFDMPERIEVERGMGGRWPLRIVDGDSPIAELVVSLAAVGGHAHLEADHLVVEDALEAFYVVLQVRDAQGLSDSLRIDIQPRDTIPPEFGLSAQVDGTGRVRWVVHGDEPLATALLLLDEQPVPIFERTERRVTWEHVAVDQQNLRLRLLVGDAAGNVASAQREVSVGWAGGGRAVHSADGQLRVLAGGARAHVLIYAEGEAYRIECADVEHFEVALRTGQTEEGLEYGQAGAWQSLPTVASNGLLRARVDGSGWLRSGGMPAEHIAQLAPRAFPNPFNAAVTIRLEMPVAGRLQVEVFDVLGRLVRKVMAEERAAGPWTAQWDGRDSRARAVASGPYLIVVDAAGQRRVVPVLLVR